MPCNRSKLMRNCLLICIIGMCFVLSGCWDRSELNENSIVTGIAIDKGDKHKYKISIESTAATELNYRTAQGLAPSFIYTFEGDTIGEITHKFNIATSTHYIFSHTRVLVIGETIAKEGILSFMDFFDRDREIRDDFNIVIAKEGNAVDLLRITNDYQKVSSLKIFPQLDNMLKDWGGTPVMKLNDYIRSYASKGQVPVLAAMTIEGSKEKGANIENITKSVPDAVGKIDSLAVFKGGKLQGYLSLEETRLLLWVQNKLEQTSLTIPFEGEENKYFGIRVLRSKTKIKAKEVEGIPQFDIYIDAESVLDGSDQKVELKKVHAFNDFEKEANNYLKKEFATLFKKMQTDYEADIFGLGEKLRDQDYKNFKKYKEDWTVGYKKAKINMHLNTDIKRSGFRNDSNH
ncbi:Ger(x)C family spore germination protein [Bacillus sp. B1-b2]|nr:Ger(x)C family spore germination protein [Bacillus sp. B1-b2]